MFAKRVRVQVPSSAFVDCFFYSEEAVGKAILLKREGLVDSSSTYIAEVVEWQTRRLQVPVVAIPCGFKSHLPHYGKMVKEL